MFITTPIQGMLLWLLCAVILLIAIFVYTRGRR